MFQIDKINSNIVGLIGWRQSFNPTYAIINAANLVSNSGSYFQDYSALVTIQNIKENQNYPEISNEDFNTLLSNLVKSGMVKVLNQVFQRNDFIENKVLYPFEQSWNDNIDNTTSFVGYELTQPTRREMIHVINKIVLSFDSIDSVKILLFHSSTNAPIDSKTIATVANSDVNISLNWDLTKEYNGGKFYIGYLRSGLTAKAKNRDWNSSNARACYNTLGIQPIIVTGWDAETLFDVETVQYESETYGLNFDITAWKDYTNSILQNLDKFVNALGLQVAIDIVDLIQKSTASNRDQRITSTMTLFELDGVVNQDVPRVAGLRQKYQAEIKRLRNNFTDTPLLSKGTL